MGVINSIKNSFPKLFKARRTDVMQSIARVLNKALGITPYSKVDGIKTFNDNDDVYSVINKIASKCAEVPFYGYYVKKDGEKFARDLMRIKTPHSKQFEVKALQLKGLDDLPETDPVFELIDSLDVEQRKFMYLCLFTTGNALFRKLRPGLGLNAGKVTQLMPLYPNSIKLKVSDTLPRSIVAYDYVIDGQTVFENVPANDIIHIKFQNLQNDCMGGELWGQSPLQVFYKRLNRMNKAMDISLSQLANGGVETIVFDKSLNNEPRAVEIMGQHKDNFGRFLNDVGNAGAPYMTAGEWGAIQLGLKLADLQLIELSNEDFKKLCNVFSVSDKMYNSDKSSTESNVKEMRKDFYTNGVLPHVYMAVSAFQKSICNEFEKGYETVVVDDYGNASMNKVAGDGKKRLLQVDTSQIEELQQDQKTQAEALNSMWWVTPNEKREIQKFDRLDAPEFEQPFIPSGLMLLSDMGIPDDLKDDTGGL